MKQTASIFTKITLGVLLAGSITACNQNKPADKTAATTAPSVKPEIVYINQDSVSLKYEYAKDMRKRMEDKGKAAQNDVGGRKQAFQREVAEYQKVANTLSADQRQTKEQDLQRKGQDLQTYEQNASAQFQNEQAGETQKLYEKVYSFSKQYAKDNGYKMILTFQTGNTQLLYADPSLEITADFLKKLNDAYAKDKK
ncbi:OmpH family outer membrane protein [Mucilaginibacter sp. BJC16-A38]|uniref:OmpH family outer membrane protein n=1 Tax=Mucilaginibacter phenanthrenivorans TaxID=1234842 RepID=UPI002158809A|nr:OmpH family outer membrane protein [Mucilaginibacter phenanthrenivorans]MCR8559754.1 OmpH family outer membrane protein [Mucilaginibacter phenanthrenivorans]